MKCLSCDCILNDYEATRKYEDGEYIDLCNKCIEGLEIVSYTREDLLGVTDADGSDSTEQS